MPAAFFRRRKKRNERIKWKSHARGKRSKLLAARLSTQLNEEIAIRFEYAKNGAGAKCYGQTFERFGDSGGLLSTFKTIGIQMNGI